MNECGVVQIIGSDGRTKDYAAYGCGHCSDTVVMHPKRSRPRLTCRKCSKWLCETKQLCQLDCTPIYEIAADHQEAATKWTKYIPALMAGLTTEAQAQKAGLLPKEIN
jgi:hypothetical protein